VNYSLFLLYFYPLAGKIDSSGEEIWTAWKRNRKEKEPVLYSRW
jgi:hypothetical protein